MQPYRELGNELDKNYDYERILSTSRGSSGSSGSITERISAILYSFVGHVREARELGRAYLHAAWQGKDWPEWLNETFFFPPIYDIYPRGVLVLRQFCLRGPNKGTR